MEILHGNRPPIAIRQLQHSSLVDIGTSYCIHVGWGNSEIIPVIVDTTLLLCHVTRMITIRFVSTHHTSLVGTIDAL